MTMNKFLLFSVFSILTLNVMVSTIMIEYLEKLIITIL